MATTTCIMPGFPALHMQQQGLFEENEEKAGIINSFPGRAAAVHRAAQGQRLSLCDINAQINENLDSGNMRVIMHTGGGRECMQRFPLSFFAIFQSTRTHRQTLTHTCTHACIHTSMYRNTDTCTYTYTHSQRRLPKREKLYLNLSVTHPSPPACQVRRRVHRKGIARGRMAPVPQPLAILASVPSSPSPPRLRPFPIPSPLPSPALPSPPCPLSLISRPPSFPLSSSPLQTSATP